jgi:hypothetical protein
MNCPITILVTISIRQWQKITMLFQIIDGQSSTYNYKVRFWKNQYFIILVWSRNTSGWPLINISPNFPLVERWGQVFSKHLWSFIAFHYQYHILIYRLQQKRKKERKHILSTAKEYISQRLLPWQSPSH